MKLKKYLSSLLVIALFASCSNEGILDSNNTSIDNVPEGAVEFNLSFPGRTFQPRTYGENVQPITNGTFAALDYEKALSHVDVFVFENITENGNDKPGKLVSINKVRFIDNNVNNVEADNTPATTTGATGKFFVRNISGKTYLVAVANLLFDDAKKKSLIGKSFSELANTLVTQEPGKHNFFPMVSEPKVVTVPNTGTAVPNHVSFLLERLSVRIDVVNESGKMFDEKELKLKKYGFNVGALNQSYLMNTLETPLANGDTKGTKYVSIWKSLETSTDGQQALSQIYTYENRNDEFVLNLAVSINDQEVIVDVPFNQPLVRNTRYLVKLKSTPDQKIGFSIEVLDWNKGADVIFNASDLINELKIEKFEQTTGNATWTPNNQTLSIGKDGSTMRLVLKGNTTPKVEVKETIIPWIKFEETALNPGEEDTNADVKAYNLTFSKNFDIYPRNAKLVLGVEGNQEDYEKIFVEVNQAAEEYGKIQNPLAILSKYYVSEVGKFDEVEGSYTDEPTRKGTGLHYQWGRNNPLNMKETTVSMPMQLPINSDLLRNGPVNTLYGTKDARKFWTNEPYTNATRWEDFVNKSGAGNKYVGTNTVVPGDPSPDGYKMPNTSEMAAIFPLSAFAVRSDFHDTNRVENGIKFVANTEAATTPVNYKADYKGGANNVIYAIRMKEGNGNKYLTAFRYQVRKHSVKITSRWLGETGTTTTIDTVADDTWWNDPSKAGGDIIRVYQKSQASFTNFGVFLNEIINVGSSSSPSYRLGVAVLHSNVGCGWGSYFGQENVILPIRNK